jgi:hypothetical protein
MIQSRGFAVVYPLDDLICRKDYLVGLPPERGRNVITRKIGIVVYVIQRICSRSAKRDIVAGIFTQNVLKTGVVCINQSRIRPVSRGLYAFRSTQCILIRLAVVRLEVLFTGGGKKH